MSLSAIPKRVALEGIQWGVYTRAIGLASRARVPRSARRSLYSAFASAVGADLDEVELPLEEYPSLGSFFARRLRAGSRRLDADGGAVISPCDGAVEACGRIDEGQLIQAKGHNYRLQNLLADDELAAQLEGESYVTIYLAPRDYHRVHAPVDLRVSGYRWVPGRLLPVSQIFARSVPELFARNERIVFSVETEAGPGALVMVGAAGVGNIGVTYPGAGAGDVHSRDFRSGARVREVVHPQPVTLRRGDEMGVFHLGSTVVLILAGIQRFAIDGVDHLRLGQVIAQPRPQPRVAEVEEGGGQR